jgi:hypothetical protein
MSTTQGWALLVVPISCSLTGCVRAPSVDIIGSYFPVWMICLTAAVALAIVFRKVLVRYKLESHLGPLALFYPCLVVLFSCLLWFTFFR